MTRSCPQLFGAALGIGNEAGAHWNVLTEGICIWEVRRRSLPFRRRLLAAYNVASYGRHEYLHA